MQVMGLEIVQYADWGVLSQEKNRFQNAQNSGRLFCIQHYISTWPVNYSVSLK